MKLWRVYLALSVLGIPASVSGEVVGKVKDWAVGKSGTDVLYSGTSNVKNNIFGQFCSTRNGKCIYQVSLPQGCEKGATYSSLVATDSASQTFTLFCGGKSSDGTQSFYTFSDFKKIDSLVRTGKKIGIVTAQKDGSFLVVRFSLVGSVATLDRMRLAARLQQKPDDRGSSTEKAQERL